MEGIRAGRSHVGAILKGPHRTFSLRSPPLKLMCPESRTDYSGVFGHLNPDCTNVRSFGSLPGALSITYSCNVSDINNKRKTSCSIVSGIKVSFFDFGV